MKKSSIRTSVRAALSLGVAATWAATGSPARATKIPDAPVYQGCDSPTAQFLSHSHTYYLDPVHGSMAGDGSQAHPWSTLQAVFAANMFANAPSNENGRNPGNPNAPIHPGDTLVLMSGDHGSILLQGQFGERRQGYFNDRFINIIAYPGQYPVIDQLTIIGASHWAFYGLTIRNTRNKLSRGYSNFIVTMRGDHDNIIFFDNDFYSDGNADEWSTSDWRANSVSGIFDGTGTCISVTTNKFRNIGFGISTQRSDKVLIESNVIDHFADDGIDYGSSNLTIRNNYIANSIEDGDGMHRDAMQGQPYTAATVVQNVLIQNNTIIRLTDPKLRFPGYLQGIDTFDGIWKNVTVKDNLIVTNAFHGISYYGVSGLLVQGNVLLNDSGRVLSCLSLTPTQCDAAEVKVDLKTSPGITVQPSKSHVPSDGVVIENNIANAISPNPNTTNISIRNNMLVLPYQGPKSLLCLTLGGRTMWASKPGTYGANNVLTGAAADKIFKAYDPVKLRYDFTLQSAHSLPWHGTRSYGADTGTPAGR